MGKGLFMVKYAVLNDAEDKVLNVITLTGGGLTVFDGAKLRQLGPDDRVSPGATFDGQDYTNPTKPDFGAPRRQARQQFALFKEGRADFAAATTNPQRAAALDKAFGAIEEIFKFIAAALKDE